MAKIDNHRKQEKKVLTEEEINLLEKIEETVLTITGFMIGERGEFQGKFLDSIEDIILNESGECEFNLGKHKLSFSASNNSYLLNIYSTLPALVNWVFETCKTLEEDGLIGVTIRGYSRISKNEIEIYW